jgi:hypothetical protein
MNLGTARIALRPRKLGESFDLGLLWCTRIARGLYLRLAAIVLLPALAACVAVRWLAQWEWAAVWALAIAIATVVQGVFTIAAGRSMFEPDLRARDVLVGFGRRLPQYLAVLFVTRLLLALGIALLVIPALWWWPQIVYVHEATLLEMHGALAARRRAAAIVVREHGEAWGFLAGAGVAIVLAIHCADMIDFSLVDFTLQLGRPFGNLLEDGGSVFALLGFFAAVPYVATVRFLRYIDGRTRRDGWDLQLAFLARALAHERDHEVAA